MNKIFSKGKTVKKLAIAAIIGGVLYYILKPKTAGAEPIPEPEPEPEPEPTNPFFVTVSPLSGDYLVYGQNMKIEWDYAGYDGYGVTISSHIVGDPWGWTTVGNTRDISQKVVNMPVPSRSGYGPYTNFEPPYDIDLFFRIGTASDWFTLTINGIHVIRG